MENVYKKITINGIDAYNKGYIDLIEGTLLDKNRVLSIPEGVERLGDYTLSGEWKDFSIEFPKSLRHIGTGCFGTSDIAHCVAFTLPPKLESIAARAFGCSIEALHIKIPKTVTSIGEYALLPATYSTVFFCEAEERPDGWDPKWCGDYEVPIVWDCNNNNLATDGNIYIEQDGIVYKLQSDHAVVYSLDKAKKTLVVLDTITYNGNDYPVTYFDWDTCGSVFSDARVENLTIGNNISELPDMYFTDSENGGGQLKTLTLGSSIEYFERTCFQILPALETIIVHEDNPFYTAIDGVLYTKDCTQLIVYPMSKKNMYFTIPTGVTSINWSAFYKCKFLLSIVIPTGLIGLSSSNFYDSRIFEIYDLNPSPEETEDSNNFGDTVAVIHRSLDTKSVLELTDDGYVFATLSDTELYLVTAPLLGEKLILPQKYQDKNYSISSKAFQDNINLCQVIIPEGVTSIGNEAFYGCTSLTSIEIPNSVSTIGNYAFYGFSSLTYIEIPNSVEMIGECAFHGCASLESVVMPNSVEMIGKYAFGGCPLLTSVNYLGTIKNWCNILFENFSNPLRAGAKLYLSGQLVTELVIPNTVTEIKNYAFQGCTSLTGVTIGSSVTSIGERAFQSCFNLTSIVIPEGVSSIGERAFYSCSSLTSLVIPSTVTSIGSSAFWECHSLTSIVIPEGVTSIGMSVFADCTSLTSIVIPESVTSIGNGAFSRCSSLTSLVIPEGVRSIGAYAFEDCDSLTSLVIPSTVTTIGSYAFWSDSGVLLDVYCVRTMPPAIQKNTFYANQINKIYAPTDTAVTKYKAATNWSQFGSKVVQGVKQ